MGFSNPVLRRDFVEQMAAEAAIDELRAEAARKKLAMKIAMAVTDKVVGEIIRPGPKPEERECYEMAAELRAIIPDIESLVAQILKVDANATGGGGNG